MYTDITSVTYSNKKNEVILEGIDLDSVILNDWSKEADPASVTFRFDISGRGPRIYLYKLTKNQVKEECRSMEEKVMALTGKIVNISNNFIQKAGD